MQSLTCIVNGILIIALCIAVAVDFVQCKNVTIDSLNGVITSHLNPETSNYNSNANDVWFIQSQHALQIDFQEFDTEYCCDYVELYSNATHVQDDKLSFIVRSGADSENQFWLQGPALVRFVSDDGEQRKGFTLRFRSVQDFDLEAPTRIVNATRSNGMVSHAKFGSQKYSNNFKICWTFIVKDDQMFVMKFDRFDTEANNDFVRIYSSNHLNISDENLKYSLSGKLKDLDQSVISVTGNVTVRFMTNSQVNGIGFRFKYKVFDTVPLNNGSITWSMSAQQSQTNQNWIINTNALVKLKFLELKMRNTFDVIKFYSNTKWMTKSAMHYSLRSFNNGYNLGAELQLQGPVIIEVLCAWSSSPRRLNISYSAIDDMGSKNIFLREAKTIFVRNSGKVFSHPTFFRSKNYNKNFQSVHTLIQTNKSLILFLEFHKFDTSPPNDFVAIYNGTASEIDEFSEPILKFSGKWTDMPRKMLNHDGNVTVLFKSDSNSAVGEGFELRYSSIYRLNQTSGSIRFQKIGSYASKQNDKWLIDSTSTIKIQFQFNECSNRYDRVELYEQTKLPKPENLKFSTGSKSDCKSQFLLQGPVVIRFGSSNWPSERNAFSLNYSEVNSTVSMATQIVDVTEITKLIAVKPSDALSNGTVRKSWILETDKPRMIHLNFSEFNSNLNPESLMIKLFSGSITNFEESLSVPFWTFSGNRNSDYFSVLSHLGNVTVIVEFDSQDRSFQNSNRKELKIFLSYYDVFTASNGTIASRTNPKTSQYYGSTNEKWLINIKSEIKIRFTKFDIQSCCDFVELYDETREVRDENLRFQVEKLNFINNKNDVLEYWLRGPVVIRFTSDGYGVKKGFSLNYSVLSGQELTLPTQVITSRTGNIASHINFGFRNYSDNSLKSWSFIQSDSQRLQINFKQFDTQSPNDFVKIFPGLAPDLNQSSILFEHSGNISTIKEQKLIFKNNFTLVFQSDSTVSKKGFVAKFQSFSQYYLSSNSGNFSSVNEANSSKYYNDADDRWIINVTGPIRISFEKFETEECCDHVKIYEETEIISEASLRFVIKNKNQAKDQFVLLGPVLIQFKTDSGVNKKGFSLRYEKVQENYAFPVTTQILRNGKPGEITSNVQWRNGGKLNKFSKAWKFVVSSNQTVVLSFTEFNLPSETEFVKIFIGDKAIENENWSHRLSGHYSNMTQTIFISAENVTVLFKSDSEINETGFKINYYYQNVHSSPNGSISSRNVTNSYFSGEDFSWLINVTGVIKIKFTELDIKSCCEFVEIYDKVNRLFRQNSDQFAFLIRENAASKYEFQLRGPVILRFLSDESVSFSKFTVEYSVIDETDPELFSPVTVINATKPGSLSDNLLNCQSPNASVERIWSLAKDPGQSLILEFQKFDSQSSEDLVEIYSGLESNRNDSLVLKFSGKISDMPQKLIINSNNLTIVVKSNCQNEDFKFSISYKTAYILPFKRFGTIRSHCLRDWKTYQTDCDRRWIINTTSIVRIKINKIDFSRCFDRLYLFDNAIIDQSDNYTFQLAFKNKYEYNEFQLQGPVTIRYRSKECFDQSKIHLEYSIFDDENKSDKIATQIIYVTRMQEIKSHAKFYSGKNDPKNRKIRWKLSVPQNEILQVKFKFFDVKLPNDSVKLYSGFPSNLEFADPLLKLSGNLSTLNQTVITHHGDATLIYESSSEGESPRGFIAEVDSYLMLNSPRGLIMSRTNSKNSKYYNYIDDKWIINSTNATIRIVFVEIDLEICCDKIRLYENTGNLTFTSKIKYSTDSDKKSKRIDAASRSEFFLQGPVLVRFLTDMSKSGRGFKLFYEILPSSSSKSTSTDTAGES